MPLTGWLTVWTGRQKNLTTYKSVRNGFAVIFVTTFLNVSNVRTNGFKKQSSNGLRERLIKIKRFEWKQLKEKSFNDYKTLYAMKSVVPVWNFKSFESSIKLGIQTTHKIQLKTQSLKFFYYSPTFVQVMDQVAMLLPILGLFYYMYANTCTSSKFSLLSTTVAVLKISKSFPRK